MRWSVVFVVLSLALSLSACGGDDESESASAAAEAIFRSYLDRDYGRAWDTLHPAHQALVGRDFFINCNVGTSVPWTSVEILREHDEIWDAPELGQQTTRTVELRLIGNQDITQGTLHMLQVDGEWRWLLDENVARAFKQGACR
ncbi:MAG: hypothetical protein DCC58_20585 [Chloroflexi bacterium]|nr:MAG: hypothetical protein DCC58_20585 [Chloroflexota bacterium]